MFRGIQKIVLLLLAGAFCISAAAQQNRITTTIDSAQTVVLRGAVSPLAKPANDLGQLDSSMSLPYVTMMLKSSAAQEASLQRLLADQQNPNSKDFHKWLTPEQFGDRFGMSRSDISIIRRWLTSQGFTVVEVAHARNWIAFSGTVGDIERVFQTQMHRFMVDGEERFANATEPSIPQALEGIVSGFRGFDNFKAKSMMVKKSVTPTPDYNNPGGSHSLAPDDIATIYDITPLYNTGVDGTGMKIAIMGQTDVHMTDIQEFRAGFNLSTNNPTTVLATGCSDPGFTGDEGEADLDLEWSGAVARNASVLFVICDTTTNSGVFSSIQYAINNNTAPVLSMSYGACEANIGTTTETFYGNLVAQGNTQGQTLMVSSADDSAAGCDNQNNNVATLGLAINGLASPPGTTAVGGTEFDADVSNPGTYWNSTNSANLASAKSYIPELAWNDGTLGTNSDGGMWGTGGGASIDFAKPVWQTGTGVPADGKRDIPDVSITASGSHDGYILCTNIGSGTYVGSCASGIASDNARVGGTSASAPVFAGIMVLLNHYLKKNNGTNPGQGNVNPTLYSLAASKPSAFHDVPAGNYSLSGTASGNMVQCQSGTPSCPAASPFKFGFLTGTGYDQATGLGTVDANVLITNWTGSSSLTPTTTTLQISSSTVTAGTSVTLTGTVSPAAATGTVNFVDTTSNTTLGSGTLASGVATFTSTTIAGGAYTVVAEYVGNTTYAASNSTSSPLNVQDFTVGPNPLAVSVSSPGQSGQGTINVAMLGGLPTTPAPTFACSGLPSESSCAFTATSATQETVTISTTAPSWILIGPLDRGNRMLYMFLLTAMAAFLLATRRKLRTTAAFGAVAMLALVVLLPGCSSSGGTHNPGTPVGQTNVTVTATDGTLLHTVTINLNVQ